jgi:hypothetical protein
MGNTEWRSRRHLPAHVAGADLTLKEFRIQNSEFRTERNFVQTCDIHRSREKNAIYEPQRASSSRSATPELLQLLTPSPYDVRSQYPVIKMIGI